MAKGYFYVYEIIYSGKVYIGYGVTKNFAVRDGLHKRTLAKQGASAKHIFLLEFESVDVAYCLETRVKRTICAVGVNISGFKQESFPIEYKQAFCDVLRAFDPKNTEHIQRCRNTRYRKLKKVGLKKCDPVDELALEIAFDPLRSYQAACELHKWVLALKQTGIESKKDLQVLLDVYELLGVKSPQSLYGAVYDLLNRSE